MYHHVAPTEVSRTHGACNQHVLNAIAISRNSPCHIAFENLTTAHLRHPRSQMEILIA